MTLIDSHLQNQGGGPGGGGGGGGGGGSDLDKLWNLLSELSSQLSQNRLQTEELHRRAEELKAQAIHNQTGYTLRRFNLDVTKEEFETDLEKHNVALVNENQALHQENRALSILLKDYEGTLENVMAKFRAHAAASQQHHLDLIRHYETLLLSSPNAITHPISAEVDYDSPDSTSAAVLSRQPNPQQQQQASDSIDPAYLDWSLSRIAALIRKAIRVTNGEDPDSIDSDSDDDESRSRGREDYEATLEGLQGMTLGDLTRFDDRTNPKSTTTARRDVSSGGYIGRGASTEPHYIPTTSTSSLVQSPPPTPLGIPLAEQQSLLKPKLKRTLSNSSSSSSNTSASSKGAASAGDSNKSSSSSWTTTSSLVDPALERQIEMEALRRENQVLKNALGIESIDALHQDI